MAEITTKHENYGTRQDVNSENSDIIPEQQNNNGQWSSQKDETSSLKGLSTSYSGPIYNQRKTPRTVERKNLSRSLDTLLDQRKTQSPTEMFKQIKKLSKTVYHQPYSVEHERDKKKLLKALHDEEATPGPGAYNPERFRRESKSPTFKNKYNDIEFKLKKSIPGPGDYKLSSTVSNGPKYTMYRKSSTEQFSGNRNTPGPLDYDVLAAEGSSSRHSNRSNSPNMGSSSRRGGGIDHKRTETTPAPGDYSIKIERGKAYRIPSAKRWMDPSPDYYFAPGPGSYDAKMPESQKYKRIEISGRNDSFVLDDQRNRSPGPAKYRSETQHAIKPKPLSFAKAQREGNHSRNNTLGPGEYSFNSFIEEGLRNKKGHQIHSSQSNKIDSKVSSVGPGSYDIRGNFDDYPSHHSSKEVTMFSTIRDPHDSFRSRNSGDNRSVSSLGISSSHRNTNSSLHSKDKLYYPGPTDYKIERSFGGEEKKRRSSMSLSHDTHQSNVVHDGHRVGRTNLGNRGRSTEPSLSLSS